ncbi:MAG: hypothetical protein HZB37_11150, partial [Planctomycetes bacterium]|nr:hypothetical protein [Planctomycetota bacterium]
EVLYRDEEILVELIFPLSVSPLNISAVFDSVKKTRKLIVVEEGTSFFNLGAEVIARINEEWDDAGAFISRRVSPGEIPIPCSGPMEKECLPSKETIIDCCKEIFSV